MLCKHLGTEELKNIKKWLDANKVAVGTDKSNFIIFHCPQKFWNENCYYQN